MARISVLQNFKPRVHRNTCGGVKMHPYTGDTDTRAPHVTGETNSTQFFTINQPLKDPQHQSSTVSMLSRLGLNQFLKPNVPSRFLHQSLLSRQPAALNNFLDVKSKPTIQRSTENVVYWKIYGNFHRHNTLLTLVAVVEDPNFIEKNPHLSYNEQVLYYLQLPHHAKLHVTAGQLGFRKAQRAEYEAGYQVSAKFFKSIEERNLISPNQKIELILKDFGKGREAFLSALQGKEGSNIKSQIVRVSDSTKLRFGGARPKKLRRL